jgi:enoyl-CoA hydratase
MFSFGVSVSVVVQIDDGVAEVVLDRPPVNALRIEDWYFLADQLRTLGRDPAVRVVVLRAEQRGFCAGVDIKELHVGGNLALVEVNRACHAAFGAVYDCQVPVIAAVHGFCLGGGIGLVGNADMLICSDDATFGLPEVDRGALGAATHLGRLVPPHRLRAMVYTCTPATAQQLQAWGSAWDVVPRAALRDTALTLARSMAAKRPGVVRLAKECLNAIDPVDVHRSYRFEQGFTYEITLRGDGDAARAEFAGKRG